MSGNFLSSVNRKWNISVSNLTQAVMFHDWIVFLNILITSGNYSFIECGTGGTSHSTTAIPTAWLNWDRVVDPSTLSPSMGDNSWVVFEASNASKDLDGLGTEPWQCKVQYTRTTSYTDPSGIDYGENASTQLTVVRVSANAGWVGNPTFDFPVVAPAGSSDMVMSNEQNSYYWIDFVGDDDTILWRGTLDTGALPLYNRARGGYIGMLRRRSTNITLPFYATMGMLDSTISSGRLAIISKQGSSNYHYGYKYYQWPSYSIGLSNVTITTHRHDTFHLDAINRFAQYPWSSSYIFPSMLVAQYQSPSDYNIIGEYRFLRAAPTAIGEGIVVSGPDTTERIQIADSSTTYGGILMRWPYGVSPIW